MRKQYSAPIIEKVVFDYKVQASSTTSCFGSVVNVSDGYVECASGNPTYIGWNSKNPGQIGGGT